MYFLVESIANFLMHIIRLGNYCNLCEQSDLCEHLLTQGELLELFQGIRTELNIFLPLRDGLNQGREITVLTTPRKPWILLQKAANFAHVNCFKVYQRMPSCLLIRILYEETLVYLPESFAPVQIFLRKLPTVWQAGQQFQYPRSSQITSIREVLHQEVLRRQGSFLAVYLQEVDTSAEQQDRIAEVFSGYYQLMNNQELAPNQAEVPLQLAGALNLADIEGVLNL